MPTTNPLPPGRIDIHSHLIPGIDDGCIDIAQSFESVRRLKQVGFVGTVCTPHVGCTEYPENTAAKIRQWTDKLAGQLRDEGLDYRVWPGGELRLWPEVIDFVKAHGVPTLAGSNCVLVDIWVDKWPKWALTAIDWFLANKYQPILAHPERIACFDFNRCIADLSRRGVWFQGNARCLTGEEGFKPDQIVRQLLTGGHYRFFALDMHRPDRLEGRLDGVALAEAEFGVETVDRLMSEAPRKFILNQQG